MNSLTVKGEEYCLLGTATPNGGFANLATAARLFTSASVPGKTGAEGVEFIQAANGNGYATGGHAISRANWAFATPASVGRITLLDQIWTATGGPISNIAGAYIVDASNNVLAWYERGATVTMLAGESYTLDDLTIRLG